MTENELTTRLAAHLHVTPDAIIGARIDGGHAVVLVDRGIKGTPRLHIPLVELYPPAEPEPDKATRRRSR